MTTTATAETGGEAWSELGSGRGLDVPRLGAIVLLMFALALAAMGWAQRRRRQQRLARPQGSGHLQVLARAHIGRHQSVALIEMGVGQMSQHLLLDTSGRGLSLLSQLPVHQDAHTPSTDAATCRGEAASAQVAPRAHGAAGAATPSRSGAEVHLLPQAKVSR